MPSSVAQYGHDGKHGVNIQNLRTLEHGAKRLPGGMRPPHDWKKETVEAMALAGNENHLSKSLRDQAKNLKDLVVTQAAYNTGRVEDALRNKIDRTSQYRRMLSSAHANTVNEMNKLAKNKERLNRLIAKKEAKLDLNDSRLRLRSERPNRELVNDQVHLTLIHQTNLLNGYLSKLRKGVNAAELDIARLDECRAQLEADLEDKEAALEVDHGVLGVGEGGGDNNFDLKKNAGTYPHRWAKSTEAIVEDASRWTRDASKLRSMLASLVSENRSQERQLETRLDSNFMSKINETRGLKQDLLRQLHEVEEEIAKARERREDLQKQLSANLPPLKRVKERYTLRRNRPHRECVHDEAETALVNEMTSLRAYQKQLQEKLAAVEKEIRTLESMAEAIKDNIADKEYTQRLDEKVILLDGRTSISRPPSVASSVASSSLTTPSTAKRSMALARIRAMESELERARSEREALERTVETIRSSRPPSAATR